MSEISSPYNFVPLSPFILRPDWAEKVSHDHPFSDGVCGEVDIKIEATSPLCVGGEQKSAELHSASQVLFNRTPDGQLAIPGSSLKGMLRNVLSIASFGHFRQVEDRRLSVRDISKANNFYSKAMNGRSVSTGWLTFEQGRWQLAPCRYVRVLHEKIITHFNLDEKTWTDRRNKTAEARYKLLKGIQALQFDKQAYKYDCKEEAAMLGQGDQHGFLVVTGQAGAGYKDAKGKKREFIFYPPDAKALVIGQQVMADFMFIHSASAEWEYWRPQVNTVKPGIPVFFHSDDSGQVKSMGLARMYRLAYEYTLHDAIGHTHGAHLQDDTPALAELIFGLIGDGGNESLRGRVNIGTALLQSECKPTLTSPMVLSSPSASFYPAYIRQPAPDSYRTLMDKDVELAGWKRYPVRKVISTMHRAENTNVQVKLETLPSGVQFLGKLRFHNLRLVELGALLWALDFGQRKYHRHSIGTGKPYGYGQVMITTTASKLRCNIPNDSDDAALLLAARLAFDDLMQQAWQEAVGDLEADWQKSPQLTQLLAMADPGEAANQNLDYPANPKTFSEYKTRNERLSPYAAVVKAAEPVATQALFTSAVPARRVEQLILAVEEKQAAEEAKQKKAAERKDMNVEERLLADLIDLSEKLGGAGSKTSEASLAKLFNRAYSVAEKWTTEQVAKLIEIAKSTDIRAASLDITSPKLGKAIKKILRDYG